MAIQLRVTLLSLGLIVASPSCTYDWDALEPDGTTATGGSGGSAGSSGTGGSGGATGGSGGSSVTCTEPGGQVWDDNGHCYFRLDSANADWSDRRDACDALGAHLVTITSQGEQNFVEPLVNGDLWIGYSKIDASEFSWITGETSNYDNWQSGEPNEAGDACVRIRDNGLWTDRACTSEYRALCERE